MLQICLRSSVRSKYGVLWKLQESYPDVFPMSLQNSVQYHATFEPVVMGLPH